MPQSADDAPLLTTLGPLSLRLPGVPADRTPGGEKLLGMLAFIALGSVERGIQRDRLLSLFWPQSTEQRARSALRNLLHRIRGILGPGSLVTTREGRIQMAPDALRVDALELLEALETGDLEGARQFADREFLPAFHVRGAAPGLEEWAARRRRRFHRRAADASLAAMEAATAERPERLVEWARRAVAHAPLDEALHRSVMELLAEHGEPVAALQLYQRLAAAMERELGVPASEEVRQLAGALKRDLLERRPLPDKVEPRRVELPPIEAFGGVDATHAAEVAELLARALESPRIAVRRTGPGGSGHASDADLRLETDLTPVPEGLRLRVRALRPSGSLLTRHQVVLSAEYPGSGIDRLAILLMADLSPMRAGRLAEIARLEAGSADALAEFISGEERLGQGDFGAALERFDRALEHDPEFVLARYRQTVAALWIHNLPLARSTARIAVAEARKLPTPERDLIDGLHLFFEGHIDAAEACYRGVLARHPTGAEAWFFLGLLLFYHNVHRGRSWAEARPCFERVVAGERPDAASLLYLSSIAAWDGRIDDLRGITDRLLRLLPVGAHPDYRIGVRAQLAFATRDEDEQEAVLEAAAGAPDLDLILALTATLSVAPEPLTVLPLVRELISERRSPGARLLGHLYGASLLLAAGRVDQVGDEIAAARRLDPAHADEFGATLALSPRAAAGGSSLPVAWFGDLFTADPPEDAGFADIPYTRPHAGGRGMIRPYLRGEVAVREGRLSAARDHLDVLARRADDDRIPGLGSSLLARLRAALLEAEREFERAVAHLETAMQRVSPLHVYTSPVHSLALARWRMARLLERLDRPEEAADWDRGQGQVCAHDIAFAAPLDNNPA